MNLKNNMNKNLYTVIPMQAENDGTTILYYIFHFRLNTALRGSP